MGWEVGEGGREVGERSEGEGWEGRVGGDDED